MIFESTRKMTAKEQMAFDLGYAKALGEIERLTAERDAAIMDVAYGNCATCKRSSDNCYPADVCDVCAGYQWRGPCAENAQEVSE